MIVDFGEEIAVWNLFGCEFFCFFGDEKIVVVKGLILAGFVRLLVVFGW